MLAAPRASYRRSLKRVPAAVKEWALQFEQAAAAPGATPESVEAGAGRLTGNMRGWMVRKYRRSQEGDWRLVFRVKGDELILLWIGPREDDYKTAARLAQEAHNRFRVV